MKKSTVFIALISAVVGALSILMVQWIFRVVAKQKRPAETVISTVMVPPSAAVNVDSIETPRMRLNACKDLYSYVCAVRTKTDPTGAVNRDSRGELQALRIYEDIIKKNPKLPMEKVDELLVKKIYTPARTKIVMETFRLARTRLLKFVDMQPFYSLSLEQKNILKERIMNVEIQLPPPASVYADEPDLYTRNDVFFEKTKDLKYRIRIGGALLFTVQSRFNLAFTLSHELAHAIDPCELKHAGIEVPSYNPIIECLLGKTDLEEACKAEGLLAETFADWVATHIVAEELDNKKEYNLMQLQSALFNSVRDLCSDDEIELTGPEVGLAASHPSNEKRVNEIFAKHPTIQRILGCEEKGKSSVVGPVPQCFWMAGPSLEPEPSLEKTQ